MQDKYVKEAYLNMEARHRKNRWIALIGLTLVSSATLLSCVPSGFSRCIDSQNWGILILAALFTYITIRNWKGSPELRLLRLIYNNS